MFDPSKSILWQIFHWLGFVTGGTTFIAGTTCYFYPEWVNGGFYAALLYTLGSFGFLSVDLLEFFTFTEDRVIRFNIFLSATGSTFYVLGSIGFFPSVYALTSVIGIWGFILGSFFIGISQLWKVHRIGSSCGEETEGLLGEQGVKRSVFKIRNLLASRENFISTGIELDAGIGAWFFFFGTVTNESKIFLEQ